MSAPDIFLSYNREDVAPAKMFADAFSAEGFEVWWDTQLRSGETYDEVTEKALRSAKAVAVLWSPRSVASQWVRAEATIAHRNKTLIPAMIEACDRPVMFELTQTAELSHWKGDRSDPMWQSYIAHIRELVGKEAVEGAPPTPTPAPDEAAESSSKRNVLLAAIAATVLALAGVSYFTGWIGGGTTAQSEERIPVLVHALEASGSGDQQEAALASGITDELMNRLRRISELQVGAAPAYGTTPSGSFAEAYLVKGNIRSAGDQLRVSIRLFHPNGELLWSETFDRKLVDLFEVQELVASNIANALSVSLDVGRNATAYGGTDNPEAYAAYMRYWENSIDLDAQLPMSFLQRAVELDPNYVRAQIGIGTLASVSLSVSPGLTQERVEELFATMDQATSQALEANSGLAVGHAARAWYWLARNDIPAAAEEIEEAKGLDAGNDPELRNYFASFAQFLGRNREGLAIRRGAQLIDPAEANNPYLVFDLMSVGEYQEATELMERLEAINSPGLEPMVAHAFIAHLLQGDEEKALAYLRQRMPQFADTYVFARDNPQLEGKSLAELREWADETFGAGGHMGIAARAAYEGHFGRDQVAVKLLRIAMERPGGNGNFYLWYPTLSGARQLPEFRELVRAMKLVDVWRESGDWGDYCRPISETDFECF